MKREVGVFISDTHAGSKHGLINPDMLFKEYDPKTGKEIFTEPLLTPINKYLWEHHSKHIKEAKYIIGKDKFHVFDSGDPTQGNKYGGGDLYSDPYNQFLIATANKEPWFEGKNKPKSMRFIWGTESHEFGYGSAPKLLRDKFQDRYPGIDIKSYAHGFINVAGVNIDIAHHGSGAGIREWTKGNVFRLYTRSIVKEYMNSKRPIPDLVVRGHFHEPIEEPISMFAEDIPIRTTGMLIPSYQLITGYAKKVTRSRYVTTIGMAVVEFIDGKPRPPHWLLESREDLTREVIK